MIRRPPSSTLFPHTTLSRSRRPSSITFLGDIDGDLARRDFTVNAIAWDPMQPGWAGVRDPFGGVPDLRRGVLRAVGKADRKSTRLNSSHSQISYAVFCLKKK